MSSARAGECISGTLHARTGPSIKGHTLFERLKPLQPSSRFIICTGFSDGDTEATARASGIDGYFLKPVLPAAQ